MYLHILRLNTEYRQGQDAREAAPFYLPAPLNPESYLLSNTGPDLLNLRQEEKELACSSKNKNLLLSMQLGICVYLDSRPGLMLL